MVDTAQYAPKAVAYTEEDWYAEGRRRFGPDLHKWKFICPCCGYIASVGEWVAADAEKQAGFSCIGRAIGAKRRAFGGSGSGPCDYAGGTLLSFNHITVVHANGAETRYMAFADES